VSLAVAARLDPARIRVRTDEAVFNERGSKSKTGRPPSAGLIFGGSAAPGRVLNALAGGQIDPPVNQGLAAGASVEAVNQQPCPCKREPKKLDMLCSFALRPLGYLLSGTVLTRFAIAPVLAGANLLALLFISMGPAVPAIWRLCWGQGSSASPSRGDRLAIEIEGLGAEKRGGAAWVF
jgi:hypothetical protein